MLQSELNNSQIFINSLYFFFFMFVNIIKSYRDLVAVCDFDLIGKKFVQGRFRLDVKEGFFRGDKTSEEKTIEIMKNMAKEDSTFNIIGEKSIDAALKAGIISKQ